MGTATDSRRAGRKPVPQPLPRHGRSDRANGKGRSGPVSRILFAPSRERAIIYLGRRSPAGSCTLPAASGRRAADETGRLTLLTWACWRWGLPCHNRHRLRGALLPHHFTLTGRNGLGPLARPDTLSTWAVSFLRHFPSARAGLALPTTVPCPVRTFLMPRHAEHAIALAHSATGNCTTTAAAFKGGLAPPRQDTSTIHRAAGHPDFVNRLCPPVC